MRRRIAVPALLLATLATGPGVADDRCSALDADVAVQGARIDAVAAALEGTWTVISGLATKVQSEKRASESGRSPAEIEFCALLSAGVALNAGQMVLLEHKMDLAEAMAKTCPSHAEIARLLDGEASDAMDPLFDSTNLLKNWQRQYCAESGN